jgi:glycosyltransferase involved in cell wall biosynthesis
MSMSAAERSPSRNHRVTMLAPFGIRPKGTLAARMLPLAQALVRRGHQVTIVAPPVHNPQDAGQRVLYGGVAVTHTQLPRLPGPAHAGEYALLLLARAMADQPEVLHLFKPRGYSGLAALLARFLSPSVALVVDTDDWEGWGGWNDLLPYPRAAKQLFAWQERDLPRRARAVTVASRTLQTQVWGAGVAPERVFYLPNGLSPLAHALLATPRPTPDPARPPVLLLYTRFWEFDVREVVATLAAIVQHSPRARLLVVGQGERGEERDLLRLAERAGLAEAITYHGWVEPPHLPALFASADIALAPIDDTLINRARCSVKLLELMASGLAVVAGRVGQALEYIEDGRSGLLVAPGDPAALARAVLRLLDDAPLREQLGAGGRERAARCFRWDDLALEAERAYGR